MTGWQRIMNWKGFGRKWVTVILRYYPAICFHGRTGKNYEKPHRIVGMPSEIRTGQLPNKNQKRFHFRQLTRTSTHFTDLQHDTFFDKSPLFWKIKCRLMRSPYYVSVCVRPLTPYECLNHSLLNFVCISWHLSPSQWRNSWILPIRNTNITASQIAEWP
jgi:hypothetical protein